MCPPLNFAGAVGIAAIGLPTLGLLLGAAVGPEIGVASFHTDKLGLLFLVSFDDGVLDVPKYLAVTCAEIKLAIGDNLDIPKQIQIGSAHLMQPLTEFC